MVDAIATERIVIPTWIERLASARNAEWRLIVRRRPRRGAYEGESAPDKPGQMNKNEAAYARQLEERQRAARSCAIASSR